MTFKELDLNSDILKAIDELGFTNPTPIQEESIPQLLDGNRDLVGLAQTGTGKTAAFGLPMLQNIDFKLKKVQGLVVAPTRELCMQIANDYKLFSKHISNAKTATIYGGASIDKQAREIKNGAQIVIATPGRLIDMIKRRLLKINQVSYVVLDEADEMLNMGFKDDIDEILSHTPKEKLTWLFSATMPKGVEKIAMKYMSNPIEITVGNKNESAKNIKHVCYQIRERDRYAAVKRIIDFNTNIYGLIFCRTKRTTQDVADKLMRDGYNAEPLHGDLSQMQRDKVMKKFRDKTLQILVATDVAARGIDVDDITHVINYHLPDDIESYTHRSGRTARAGKFGTSVAFISAKEKGRVKAIERHIKTKFHSEEIPSGKEVCRQQLFSLIDKIINVEVKKNEIEEFLPPIFDQFVDFSKEEIIVRFVSAEFNKFLNYYERSGNLNAKGDSSESNSRQNSYGSGEENKERFYINQGFKSGLNKGALLRIICSYGKVTSQSVGRLDLFNDFSFFEIDKEYSDKILKGMDKNDFEGNKIKVEIASKNNSRRNKSRGRGRGRGERRR
jgi:ATP-dependent RNA helicase DeaD